MSLPNHASTVYSQIVYTETIFPTIPLIRIIAARAA